MIVLPFSFRIANLTGFCCMFRKLFFTSAQVKEHKKPCTVLTSSNPDKAERLFLSTLDTESINHRHKSIRNQSSVVPVFLELLSSCLVLR